MTAGDAVAAPVQITSQPNEKREKRPKRKSKFVGFSEQLERKRKDRESRPRPWIERKFAVGLTIALASYTWYVYVGRFCVPMIRRDPGALGGRGMGIAFLVVFCILGLMFWWCYIKLILTHPGFARDHVPQTSAPNSQTPRQHISRSRDYRYEFHDEDTDEEDDVGGMPYSEIPPHASEQHTSSQSPQEPKAPPQAHYRQRDTEKAAHEDEPSLGGTGPIAAAVAPSSPRSTRKTSGAGTQHTRPLNDSQSEGRSPTADAQDHPFQNPKLTPLPPKSPQAAHTNPQQPRNHDLPPLPDSRRPPSHPALLPEYRYCYRDQLVKPMRAHHCRVCGTCVLAYDHHCPWIGQCVGARNQKFFLNFLQWATIWLDWIFATLLARIVQVGSRPSANIDPEHIVIIAVSAFFTLFTTMMLLAHIRFTTMNQTSVETLGFQAMRRRESDILHRLVPLSGWWKGSNVHQRRKALRKEWDQEWGKLNTEGNIWWLGSWSANWKHRMGRNPWGWFLPISSSEGDGLTYPTNPRFDAEGRWRRRSEWPAEL